MKQEIFPFPFREFWKAVFPLIFCLSIAGIAPVFSVKAEAEFHGYLVQLDTGPRLLSEENLPPIEEICAAEGVWRVPDWESVRRLQEDGLLLHVEPDFTVTLDDPPEELYFPPDGETEGVFSNPDFFPWAGAKANLKNLFPRPGTKIELADAASSPDLENQWYFAATGADFAREQGVTGQGVRVGVIDSGVFAGHEDFEGIQILSGINYCVSANSPSRQDTSDTYGHGTFVSGLIAAAVNGYGIAGLSPDVELVPLKCFEGKKGDVSNIVKAVYDGVNLYQCQVLNLSLGIVNESLLLCSAIQYAVSAGVIITSAAGNRTSGSAASDRDPPYYPAAYAEVISVGAVQEDLTLSSFSCRNESVWVVAPGSALQSLSHTRSDGYTRGSGTSYASPMVAAAAALALSADPSLTRDEFSNLLRDTAKDLGDPGYDTSYGYGLLQIGDMVEYLLLRTGRLPNPTPTPTAEPTPTPTEDTPLSLRISFQSPEGRELPNLSDWAADGAVQALGELRANITLDGIPESLREANLLLAVYDQNQSLAFYHLWPLRLLSDFYDSSETISISEELEAASGKVMLLDQDMKPLLAAFRLT